MGSVYDTNRHNEVFFYRNVDYPVSNQKANELKSRLTAIYCRRQLRFFTVYGPWGRPDITMYIFAKAMSEGLRIRLFNYGRMRRDFASVDVLVVARERHSTGRRRRSIPCSAVASIRRKVPRRSAVYNIGNNSTVEVSYWSNYWKLVWSQSRNGARADAAWRCARNLCRCLPI